MAFISATPMLARTANAFAPVASPTRRPRVATAARPVVTMGVPTVERFPKKKHTPAPAPTRAPAPMERVPQGFTAFFEKLNGRFAMMGFFIGLSTELITGKGMLAQMGSVFEIFNLAEQLGN